MEQSGLVHALHSRLDDLYRQYEENTRDNWVSGEKTEPANAEVYTKRLAEDLKMIREELKSKILLPHQVQLLDKFQQKILFEWHLQDNFRRIKGTRLESLNFSDEQLKRITEIKQQFNKQYMEERERFETAVDEMRDELSSQIHDEMTDEQRELLNIK